MKILHLVICAALAAMPLAAAMADEDPFADQRKAMVDTIIDNTRGSKRLLGGDGIDPRVLEVMGRLPRHEFIPGGGGKPSRNPLTFGGASSPAYEDRPVAIGYGQTISQPTVVAMMTHLLRTQPDHVVLEIGTGSGYQAAVLSPLVGRLCTIEIIPQLAKSAARVLNTHGRGNISTRTGDGYDGWPDCGPFDSIIVTAAASHIPPPLVQQLKPGGRMVIPVGSRFTLQQLTLVEKDEAGKVTTRQLLPVAFVPLTRSK